MIFLSCPVHHYVGTNTPSIAVCFHLRGIYLLHVPPMAVSFSGIVKQATKYVSLSTKVKAALEFADFQRIRAI